MAYALWLSVQLAHVSATDETRFDVRCLCGLILAVSFMRAVLRQERVFHNFDPIKAHKSQFLHPILRYYAPDVQSSAEGGETAAHHVLECVPALHHHHRCSTQYS